MIHHRLLLRPLPSRLSLNDMLGIAISLLLMLAPAAHAQTWTALNHPPSFAAGTAILLTDGTVMVQQMSSGFGTGQWWKLTPDNTGSYVNGTWSQLASMPSGYAPLYYASAVLPDGRVVVVGGEYNGNSGQVETNLGAIYNPASNTWTSVNPPSGVSRIGDAASVILSNGTFMLGGCCSSTQYLLNASNLTWTATGSGKADSESEEGWTLLPSGKVLTVDTEDGTNSELYNPSTGSWSSAGSTIVQLANSSVEMGPQVLRPDGTVFAAGGTSNTAIYNSATGAWSVGPTFPSGLDVADGPAALLPTGNVLVDSSPGTFQNGSQFFEFNGTNLLSAPNPPRASGDSSFVGRMLVLPSGQILFTDQSTQVEIYTASGTFQNSWRPTVSSVASTLNPGSVNNAISGTQFNGLSQGAMYGDDSQAATNYPLVQITNNSTGHVFYAKTHNHSTMAVATGSATVSTQFDVPSNIETGASTLRVVANGIPSTGTGVTIPTPAAKATGVIGFTGGFDPADLGTIAVTVNNTTETINYDGSGGTTGTGFGYSGAPGITQTIAPAIANAFNNDPNSPVTATVFDDTYLDGGWDVIFTAKQSGPGGDYSITLTVTSIYGTFQPSNNGSGTIQWSMVPFAPTGGADPAWLTEAVPDYATMTGGK